MKYVKMIVAMAIAVTSVTSASVYFALAVDDVSSQTILDTGSTVIDQGIQYPAGTPKVTSKIVTVPAGAETGQHVHEYPMFAYIMEGKITVDYQDGFGTKVYSKGDALVEATDVLHNGRNAGDKPTKILVVVMGQE